MDEEDRRMTSGTIEEKKSPTLQNQLAAAATLYAAYPNACKTSSATARVAPFYVRAISSDWEVFGRFTRNAIQGITSLLRSRHPQLSGCRC